MSKIDFGKLNGDLWDVEILAEGDDIPGHIKEEFPALFPIVITRSFIIAGFTSLVKLTEQEVDFLQAAQDAEAIFYFTCTQRKSGYQNKQVCFMPDTAHN